MSRPQRRRDHDGQHEQRNKDLPAGKALQKQQGHQHSEDELGRQCDGTDNERVQDREPEPRVFEQRNVIQQAWNDVSSSIRVMSGR